jgi:hypothetical protein
MHHHQNHNLGRECYHKQPLVLERKDCTGPAPTTPWQNFGLAKKVERNPKTWNNHPTTGGDPTCMGEVAQEGRTSGNLLADPTSKLTKGGVTKGERKRDTSIKNGKDLEMVDPVISPSHLTIRSSP